MQDFRERFVSKGVQGYDQQYIPFHGVGGFYRLFYYSARVSIWARMRLLCTVVGPVSLHVAFGISEYLKRNCSLTVTVGIGIGIGIERSVSALAVFAPRGLYRSVPSVLFALSFSSLWIRNVDANVARYCDAPEKMRRDYFERTQRPRFKPNIPFCILNTMTVDFSSCGLGHSPSRRRLPVLSKFLPRFMANVLPAGMRNCQNITTNFLNKKR